MVQSELSENCTTQAASKQLPSAKIVASKGRFVRLEHANQSSFSRKGKCNEVVLRRGDGSFTGWLEHDRLTVATETEVADYVAEFARWAQFSSFAAAKTAEGDIDIGVVTMDADSGNKVRLRLAASGRLGNGLHQSGCTVRRGAR